MKPVNGVVNAVTSHRKSLLLMGMWLSRPDRAGPMPVMSTAASSRTTAGDPSVFPVLRSSVFFDHAAVSPLPAPVADAMRSFITTWSEQGPQLAGYDVVRDLRVAAAQLCQVEADEVAIVPNTSTGLATVAGGLALGEGDVVVTTSIEFPANLNVWMDRARLGLRVVPVEPRGDGFLVHDDDIVAAMREAFSASRGTRLLAISHVQFSTGQRHDIARLAAVAHELGGLVCVDAIQSLGQLPVRCTDWEIDFVSADGHKWMLGPEGTGIFVCRRGHFERLRPPIVGWLNMEQALRFGLAEIEFASTARRYEPGAHSMVGIAGLNAALRLILDEGVERIEQRITALTGRLAQGARTAGHDVVAWPGGAGREDAPDGGGCVEDRPTASGIVAVRPRDGETAESWAERLRMRRIRVAARRGLLRISPHFYNTTEQVDEVVAALRS